MTGCVVEQLSNGMVLLIEEIPHVASAAYELYLPTGIITDREERLGTSLVLAELTSRGAGDLDARALSEAFDNLGAVHSESAGLDRTIYRGVMLARHISSALELLQQMVRSPQLPEDEVEGIQSLFLHDLRSLVDNPGKRALIELASRYYPGVWGRSVLGTIEGIESLTAAFLRKEHAERFTPRGAILSVAGRVQASQVRSLVQRCFGDWTGESPVSPPVEAMPRAAQHHLNFESAQQQIALAYPSTKFGDPLFYAAKIATGVLSGGMFGRLFMEAREKRGLCYSIYARHGGAQQFGTVTIYAGTTPERAHETLDVIKHELSHLHGTVTAEELDRVKVNSMAASIIGEESTAARASSNASDWWHGRRVRPLQEILDNFTAVSSDAIDRYLETFPSSSPMMLTLGPRNIF